MSEELSFSIGSDANITVRSWDELLRWLETERAKWGWLVRNDGRTDRQSVATTIHNTWDNVIAEVTSLKNQAQSLISAQAHLAPLNSGPILISTSPDGATVLDILQTSGDMSASFAAGFIKSLHGLSVAQTPADLMGAMLCVASGLDDPAHLSDLLKRERTNFRNTTRSIVERVDKEAIDRNDDNAKLVRRLMAVATRKFVFKRAKWTAAQSAINQAAFSAVTKITDTDNTFKEFMKLKAPAQYWTDKAVEHGKKEKSARRKLYWFFPITGVVAAVAFVWTAKFLLSHPDTAGSKAPVS